MKLKGILCSQVVSTAPHAAVHAALDRAVERHDDDHRDDHAGRDGEHHAARAAALGQQEAEGHALGQLGDKEPVAAEGKDVGDRESHPARLDAAEDRPPWCSDTL